MKTRIAAAVIGLIIGAYLGGFFSSETIHVYTYNHSQISASIRGIQEIENASFALINVPAVDNEGRGVTTTLMVQIVEGSGRTLVNVDNILFWTDTQNSIRTASSVAENLTGFGLSDYDLVYTIMANASVIEGPSAGAALAIVTVAALEGKELNSTVMITGTLNHDGTIGPVGGVLEKAITAKTIGATTFLVPLGQSSQITYESKRHCEQIGWTEFCTIEQVPKKVDIEEQVGINVEEVATVEEAMEYFFD